MAGQAAELRRLLADRAGVEAVASRLSDRRILLAGTGTSWHAAGQGATILQLAGLDADVAQSADVAQDAFPLARYDVLVALSHTGAKRYTAEARHRARTLGLDVVEIGGLSADSADLRTVERERSAAYTASHLAALLRLAQLAEALGAGLGSLEDVPDAVDAVVTRRAPAFTPPARLLELIGGGINAWTAAEGALKVRETAYVASEGLSVEQFLHGPSVALRGTDHLVCLDGGGPWRARVAEIARAANASGVRVTVIEVHDLGEPLSVFPLTAAVHRIALESAEVLGTNPDSFGRDLPEREPWSEISL